MLSQKKKMIKKDPQSKLKDHYIVQSTLSKQDSFSVPNYSELPGIQKIKKEISDLFLFPLLSKNPIISNKLILKGNTGIGKTFLIKSICKENEVVLIKSKSTELQENIEKARLFSKSLIHITDLETLEGIDSIETVCILLEQAKDVFIVGEIVNNIDSRLLKFGCFENEIVMTLPNEIERNEILFFLYKKNQEIQPNLMYDHKEFTFIKEIAKNTPGYNASDLCILCRKAISKSIIRNEILSYDHFFETLHGNKKIKSNVSFDDIGGLEDVKKELFNSIILPSLHPEKYKILGLKRPSGILLFGPPGCGKTILAKAVANMNHNNFISIKGPELISKFVGETEKELRGIFEKAKQLQPCVIFFDEIDSLCNKRGNSDYNDRIVNQILTLMDGFDERGDVFVIGATNRLQSIDEAFLRPGRFDKIIEIKLPNFEERKMIFEKCTKNLEFEQFNFEDLDTRGFSGADISGIVKEASILFIEESINNISEKLHFKYFEKAINKMKKI